MEMSHVILRVSDMERSLAFYRDQVGLPVLSESAAFSFLDVGTTRLALNVFAGVGPDTSATEIVLEVEDLQATFAAMTARGVPFEIEPRQVMQNEGRSLHAAHFRDPDGHIVSITGWGVG